MSVLKMWMGRALALGVVLVGLCSPASAATGTVQERVLTFTDVNTLNFTVNTADLTVVPGGSEPTVILLLDFATDGSDKVPATDPFTSLSSVSFTLTYDGASIVNNLPAGGDFTFTANQTLTTPFVTKNHTAGSPNVSLFGKQLRVGEYYISLGFPTGADTLTKDWSLAITGAGFPSSVRGHAYIEQGKFKSLGVHAACPSGGVSCPAGQSCKGPCPFPPPYCVTHPWSCLRERVWIPKWEPWPGPGPNPCLSCPEPWKEKFGDEFERKLFSFVALNKDGGELGSEQTKQIQLSVVGGRAVGELVNLGGSEYAQLLEVRKGQAPPQVSAKIAGASAPVFVAGPAAQPSNSRLTLILVALLALALIAIGYLFSRGPTGASRG